MPQPPLLLFPTHYVGNLVLGLPWVLRVLDRHAEAAVVFDANFRPLVSMLPNADERALYYPRKELAGEKGFSHRLHHYLGFLGELRKYKRHCLIDMEGERFSGAIARLSGCRRRIGPAAKRARWFYSDVLDLDYLAHRFNAFGEILGEYAAGGPPSTTLDFQTPSDFDRKLRSLLEAEPPQSRIQAEDTHAGSWDTLASIRPLAVIHPGASVRYKLWPREHFARLVRGLHEAGLQVAWIGAGQFDAEVIAGIERELADSPAINLCNRLSLPELVALFRRSRLFVGCDSGPMHLAAAAGLPVFALFGPSREAIWAPLGERSTVLRGELPCAEDCDAWHCRNDYHCLRSLTPDMVLARIAESRMAVANN